MFTNSANTSIGTVRIILMLSAGTKSMTAYTQKKPKKYSLLKLWSFRKKIFVLVCWKKPMSVICRTPRERPETGQHPLSRGKGRSN